MEIKVNENPRQVCSVNTVPVYLGSDNSVRHAENWAESETTVNPHIRHMGIIKNGDDPKNKPAATQQKPLITMEYIVISGLPCRSARYPANAQPNPPIPITKKDVIEANC
jgi:hypothetical protein